jgi:hypothetical protein
MTEQNNMNIKVMPVALLLLLLPWIALACYGGSQDLNSLPLSSGPLSCTDHGIFDCTDAVNEDLMISSVETFQSDNQPIDLAQQPINRLLSSLDSYRSAPYLQIAGIRPVATLFDQKTSLIYYD